MTFRNKTRIRRLHVGCHTVVTSDNNFLILSVWKEKDTFRWYLRTNYGEDYRMIAGPKQGKRPPTLQEALEFMKPFGVTRFKRDEPYTDYYWY